MSYDPRQAARAYGEPYAVGDQDGRKGSVRAARERMQADQMRMQLPDTSKIIGLPQRPNQLVSQYSNQNVYEQPRLAPTTDYRGAGNTVSPTPQWPLANYDEEDDNTSPILPPRSPKRLQRPQQDIRPISDEFPIQQQSPGYSPQGYSQNLSLHPDEYRGEYANDEMFSPNSYRSSRPLTTSSAASESSSLGSIPDFPVPQPPVFVQQSRRQPSLGPPPSSRRGPSSYYTQMSYVSPIAEESETRSDRSKSRHGSYASSNVFPSNPGDMYRDDYIFSDDEETITSDRGTLSPTDTDDKSGLVTPQSALLRQASLGRRTKPSLMTIRSVDSVGDKKNGTAKRKAVGVGLAAGAMATGSAKQTTSSIKGTGYYDASSSSESVDTIKNLKSQIDGYSGYGSPPLTTQQEVRPKTLAERVGERRPPRLDVDAVRDAEARGSLTSLPDLIRRATRLAANLDRGKTASRLGLDFWEAGAPDKKDTRQSGLSDMLAAFPPPGQDTPNRAGTPNNRMSKWPSAGIGSRAGMTDSALSNEKQSGRRRKCCGMPMWTFITLLIVLLFIIAAAVVIPVVLIVIPNQNSSNAGAQQENQGQNSNGNNNPASTANNPALPAPTVAPGTNQCDGVITCQNGGVAVLNSDRTCNCICINGFTGRSCTNNDATGCTTTSVDTVNNATMGSGIPRLIETATTDFNVPLNGTRILSLFSTLSLSCAAENALITFNGLASRSVTQSVQSVQLEHIAGAWRSLSSLHHSHHLRTIHRLENRQAIGEVESTNRNQNQNQAVANQPSTTQAQPISSNVTALDFARVSVLLALQESGELDTAANAQEAIQNFLSNNQNGNAGTTISLNIFQLDLVNLSIRFQNGTTIGARK